MIKNTKITLEKNITDKFLILKNTKLFCIKDYTEDGKYSFKKDKYYQAIITGQFNDEVNIADDNGEILEFNTWSFFNESTVSSYFVLQPLKEVRKEKLEKINKIR